MSNNTDILWKVVDLKMHFPIYRGVFQRQVGAVHAVDGVSFDVKRGETLGLVGESGCGKSTTGRTILQLYKPTAGEVIFEGTDLVGLKREEMRWMRRQMQMIFHTLTLAGDRLIARQGASLLTAAGLPDWVADSADDFVALALAHAADLPKLAALRAGLRAQVLASPLFDAARFARDLADALWAMWRRWREGRTPPCAP